MIGGDGMKESCMNCARRDACLLRSAAIFELFIVTGREDMVPDAKKHLSIRPSCTSWKWNGEQET